MIEAADFKDLIKLSVNRDASPYFVISTARLSLSEKDFLELFKDAVSDGVLNNDFNLAEVYLCSVAEDRELLMWCKMISYVIEAVPRNCEAIIEGSIGGGANAGFVSKWLCQDFYDKKSLLISEKKDTRAKLSPVLTVKELIELRHIDEAILKNEVREELSCVGFSDVLSGLARTSKKHKSKAEEEISIWIEGHCKRVLESVLPAERGLLIHEISAKLVEDKMASIYIDVLTRAIDAANAGEFWKESDFLETVLNYAPNNEMELKWFKIIEEKSSGNKDREKAFEKLKKQMDLGRTSVGNWWEHYKLSVVASDMHLKVSKMPCLAL